MPTTPPANKKMVVKSKNGVLTMVVHTEVTPERIEVRPAVISVKNVAIVGVVSAKGTKHPPFYKILSEKIIYLENQTQDTEPQKHIKDGQTSPHIEN